jgi:hypothetical protein
VQGLRQQISDEAPQLNTSLANWWNVYDAFNVWRTYRVGDVMPDLDNATYGQVMAIAHWLEVAKMRSALTGSLLGGPLLADILGRLGAAGDAWTSSARVRGRGRASVPGVCRVLDCVELSTFWRSCGAGCGAQLHGMAVSDIAHVCQDGCTVDRSEFGC